MLPIIFIILTSLSTYLGGIFALKYIDKEHLLLAFAGGSVLGVCFFDLIPESIEYTSDSGSSILLIFVGFMAYYLINQLLPVSFPNEDNCDNPLHKNVIGALPFCLHSLFDGIGIGLAWHTHNLALGITVSLGILLHDFSDGISVVCMLKKSNIIDKFTTKCWLVADAFAPMIGFASTYFFSVSEKITGIFLSIFAGFLLYIGANFLIPETHHKHSKFNIVLTLLGALMMYLITKCV